MATSRYLFFPALCGMLAAGALGAQIPSGTIEALSAAVRDNDGG